MYEFFYELDEFADELEDDLMMEFILMQDHLDEQLKLDKSRIANLKILAKGLPSCLEKILLLESALSRETSI